MKSIILQDVLEQFAESCQLNGLLIDAFQLIADGELHRCPVIESRKSKTSGAYFLYAQNESDYPFNGYIQNFKSGVSFKWQYKSITRTPIKQNIILSAQSDTIINTEQQYLKSAYVAYKIYQNGHKYATGDSYLSRKQVKAFGVMFRDFNGEQNIVTVPARDINGKIWSIQSIFKSGHKQFLKDSKKIGMFHKIGFVNLPVNYSGNIFIAEGYATGASLFMALNEPTICAFDAGNLLSVATTLKQTWPLAKLVFCADLDYAGISKAFAAATQFNASIVIPDIAADDGYNDFNDLHCVHGLSTINQQIQQQDNQMTLIMVKAYKLFKDEITPDQIDSRFLNLADKIIKAYYVVDEARQLNEINDFTEQTKLVLAINANYHVFLKAELSKLQARKYYLNVIKDINPFLSTEVNLYIDQVIIPTEAERICNLENIQHRQSAINKINPLLQNQLKSKILELWNKK